MFQAWEDKLGKKLEIRLAKECKKAGFSVEEFKYSAAQKLETDEELSPLEELRREKTKKLEIDSVLNVKIRAEDKLLFLSIPLCQKTYFAHEFFCTMNFPLPFTIGYLRDPAKEWGTGTWVAEGVLPNHPLVTKAAECTKALSKLEWNWEEGIFKVPLTWGAQIVPTGNGTCALCIQTAEIECFFSAIFGIKWFFELSKDMEQKMSPGKPETDSILRFFFAPRQVSVLEDSGLNMTEARTIQFL